MISWIYTISLGVVINIGLFSLFLYTGLGEYLTQVWKSTGLRSKQAANLFFLIAIANFFLARVLVKRWEGASQESTYQSKPGTSQANSIEAWAKQHANREEEQAPPKKPDPSNNHNVPSENEKKPKYNHVRLRVDEVIEAKGDRPRAKPNAPENNGAEQSKLSETLKKNSEEQKSTSEGDEVIQTSDFPKAEAAIEFRQDIERYWKELKDIEDEYKTLFLSRLEEIPNIDAEELYNEVMTVMKQNRRPFEDQHLNDLHEQLAKSGEEAQKKFIEMHELLKDKFDPEYAFEKLNTSDLMKLREQVKGLNLKEIIETFADKELIKLPKIEYSEDIEKIYSSNITDEMRLNESDEMGLQRIQYVTEKNNLERDHIFIYLSKMSYSALQTYVTDLRLSTIIFSPEEASEYCYGTWLKNHDVPFNSVVTVLFPPKRGEIVEDFKISKEFRYAMIDGLFETFEKVDDFIALINSYAEEHPYFRDYPI